MMVKIPLIVSFHFPIESLSVTEMQILIVRSQTSFFSQIGIMLPGTQIGTFKNFMLIRNCFGVYSFLLALSFDGILVRKMSLPSPSEPSSHVIFKLFLRKMIGSLWDDH